MTVKTYLGQLKNIDRRIKDKISEADRWREIAKNPSSAIKEIQVQTSIKPDKMGDAVALAVTYEKESEELAKQLTEFKHKIIIQIDGIGDETYYNLLKSYYIMNMTYEEISATENKSYRHVKRIFQDALDAFDAKYGSTYKESKPIWYRMS